MMKADIYIKCIFIYFFRLFDKNNGMKTSLPYVVLKGIIAKNFVHFEN